jgi:hypothetical protein
VHFRQWIKTNYVASWCVDVKSGQEFQDPCKGSDAYDGGLYFDSVNKKYLWSQFVQFSDIPFDAIDAAGGSWMFDPPSRPRRADIRWSARVDVICIMEKGTENKVGEFSYGFGTNSKGKYYTTGLAKNK